jgi:hypothetical protein
LDCPQWVDECFLHNYPNISNISGDMPIYSLEYYISD